MPSRLAVSPYRPSFPAPEFRKPLRRLLRQLKSRACSHGGVYGCQIKIEHLTHKTKASERGSCRAVYRHYAPSNQKTIRYSSNETDAAQARHLTGRSPGLPQASVFQANRALVSARPGKSILKKSIY